MSLKEKLEQAECDTIVINLDETTTNGDVIKTLFPDKASFNGGYGSYFDKEWWNAPYKAESEDKE